MLVCVFSSSSSCRYNPEWAELPSSSSPAQGCICSFALFIPFGVHLNGNVAPTVSVLSLPFPAMYSIDLNKIAKERKSNQMLFDLI